MKKTILLLAIFATFLSCSKDSETCAWNTALLSGKTYKPTKYESNGVDITASLITLDPCIANSVSFAANGTYTEIKASGCTASGSSGTWSVSTSNGKNYLIVDGSSNEITSFDCNNIVTIGNINGASIKVTITKQ